MKIINKNNTLFTLIKSRFDEDYIIERINRDDFCMEEYSYQENQPTPFLLASYYGMNEVIKVMLNKLDNNSELFDLNTTDTFGDNALMIATNKKHIDVIKTLIGYYKKHPTCFNINATNNRGQSALHLLLYLLHEKTLPLLKSFLTIKELNVNLTDNSGATAFLYCMSNYTSEEIKVQVFDFLIKYNSKYSRFDLNKSDVLGYNAFLTTCAQDDVERLLERFFNHPELFNLYSTLCQGKNALAVAEHNESIFQKILHHSAFQNSEFLYQALEGIDMDKKDLQEVVEQHIIDIEQKQLEKSINTCQNPLNLKIQKI